MANLWLSYIYNLKPLESFFTSLPHRCWENLPPRLHHHVFPSPDRPVGSGLVTAIIGDVAAIFGCCLGIKAGWPSEAVMNLINRCFETWGLIAICLFSWMIIRIVTFNYLYIYIHMICILIFDMLESDYASTHFSHVVYTKTSSIFSWLLDEKLETVFLFIVRNLKNTVVLRFIVSNMKTQWEFGKIIFNSFGNSKWNLDMHLKF